MAEWIFGNWMDAARAAFAGVLTYGMLVLLLRVSGKRTVAKWNAFDLVVTVALGSVLATTILSSNVSLLKGFGAAAVLVFLQFAITWTSLRIGVIDRSVKARPSILVHRGELRRETMRRERVNEDEVLAAARRRGFGDLKRIEAIVLETDGSFSVIGSSADEIHYSTLEGVEGTDE